MHNLNFLSGEVCQVTLEAEKFASSLQEGKMSSDFIYLNQSLPLPDKNLLKTDDICHGRSFRLPGISDSPGVHRPDCLVLVLPCAIKHAELMILCIAIVISNRLEIIFTVLLLVIHTKRIPALRLL